VVVRSLDGTEQALSNPADDQKNVVISELTSMVVKHRIQLSPRANLILARIPVSPRAQTWFWHEYLPLPERKPDSSSLWNETNEATARSSPHWRQRDPHHVTATTMRWQSSNPWTTFSLVRISTFSTDLLYPIAIGAGSDHTCEIAKALLYALYDTVGNGDA
jgi:hypothetical protein